MGHGSMSYQLKIARLIIIFINVIFFLIGATLLGEGIDLLINRRFQNFTDYLMNIENSIISNNKLLSEEILYIVLIIPGLVFLFTGFFGCSGAITQIHCLLFSYSWIIAIILFFQTIILMFLIAFRAKLHDQLILSIYLFLRNDYKGPFEKNLRLKSFLWDLMMYYLKCCGLESKNDFNLTTQWNRINPWWNNSKSIEYKYFKYPLTCCPINDKLMSFDRLISCGINGTNIYEIGCFNKVIDIIYSNQNTILIIISFIMLIEIFALTFVLVIYNRNQRTQVHQVMEGLPPPYRLRTRVNNTHTYFPISNTNR